MVVFKVSVGGLGLSQLGPTLPKRKADPAYRRRQHWLLELVLQMYSA